MKLLPLFIFSLLMINNLYSQEIIRIHNQYILIDIDKSSGLKIGDDVNVIRVNSPESPFIIGKVKIVRYQNGRYAGKILSVKNKYQIKKGDHIQIQQLKYRVWKSSRLK